MQWIAIASLLVGLSAPIQPVQKAPTTKKVTPVVGTTGGAAAEPSATTRRSPPAQARDVLRDLLPRLGEPIDVTPQEQTLLDATVVALRKGDQTTALELWTKAATSFHERTASADPNTLAQWVLRESYLDTNEDLRAYVDVIKHFNQMKKRVRDHLEAVRAELNEPSAKSHPISMKTLVVATKPRRGKKPVVSGKTKTMSAAHWDAYADALEQKLQAAGDDAQTSQLMLQDALQKQMQTMQMLSNLSKSLHDTAKAIIDNMKG